MLRGGNWMTQMSVNCLYQCLVGHSVGIALCDRLPLQYLLFIGVWDRLQDMLRVCLRSSPSPRPIMILQGYCKRAFSRQIMLFFFSLFDEFFRFLYYFLASQKNMASLLVNRSDQWRLCHRPVCAGCAEFLENLGIMIFSDYRMIHKFAEDCGPDIDKHQCGRLEDDDEVGIPTWYSNSLATRNGNDDFFFVEIPDYLMHAPAGFPISMKCSHLMGIYWLST